MMRLREVLRFPVRFNCFLLRRVRDLPPVAPGSLAAVLTADSAFFLAFVALSAA